MLTVDEQPSIPVKMCIDCTGQAFALPAYVASRALAALQAGEVLEVRFSEPGSIREFLNYTKLKGHLLLLRWLEGSRTSVFYVQKGPGAAG